MAKIPADYLPPKELWADYTEPAEFPVPDKLNLAEFLLDRHIKEGRGDQPAILFGDTKITYKELLAMANKFANVLKGLGVEAQDRVGIRMTNAPEPVAINFAIMKLGAIPVPVSPLWAKEEVAFVVNNAEFKVFVVSFPLMGPVEASKHEWQVPTKVVVVGGEPEDTEAKGNISFAKAMAGASDQFSNVMVSKNDLCVILYTSGTTGQPKGCVHFVKEVYIESQLVNKYVYKLGPGEVLGGSAPITFAAGYGTFCLIPFAGGGAISLLPKFNPNDMMATIQKHKVTVVIGLPSAYRKLLEMPNFNDYDISSVRIYTSSGDALTGKTLSQWKAKTGKPIWEGLSSTETLHLVTSNTMSDLPMPDSIGKALPGFEIKVVLKDGTTAGPGEVGSMMIKGPTAPLPWKPYIQDKKLLATMKKGIKDGYNAMGDAVMMDKDGYIFFKAREDDMIKSSGFRLAPTEIESAISSQAAVRDTKVVGMPDEIMGQKVVAYVKLETGNATSQAMANDIINSTMNVLPTYKRPREVVFVDALPRTSNGQINKNELQRNYPKYPHKYVPETEPQLYWNVWAEDGTEGRFEPVAYLMPNTRYRLCLDLAALKYLAAGAQWFEASESFKAEVKEWLKPRMPYPTLKVLLLADPAKFDTSPIVKDFKIDLQGLRKVCENGLPDFEENPFAVLQQTFDPKDENKNPDFRFGGIYFEVKTKDQEGLAALAFSIWYEGRPIDEVSYQFCIARSPETMQKICPKEVEIVAPQGMLTVRVAAERIAPPTAAVHFVSLGQGELVTGIFRVSAWEEYKFLVWQFPQKAADDFRNMISKKLQPLYSPDWMSDDDLLRGGWSLFLALFPADASSFNGKRFQKGKKVQKVVLDFFRSQLQKDRDSSDYVLPTLFVRMIQTGPSTCAPIPLGLLAVKLDKRKKMTRKNGRFLGEYFLIEAPLEVQSYKPSTECLSRWVMVLPPEDISESDDADLYDAQGQLAPAIANWSKPEKAFNLMTKFGEWLQRGSDSQKEDPSTILVTLSHHDSSNLFS